MNHLPAIPAGPFGANLARAEGVNRSACPVRTTSRVGRKVEVRQPIRARGNEDQDRARGGWYSLHELANNLGTLMRGNASIAEWNAIYVGQDAPPLDLDKHMPGRSDDVEGAV